MKCTAKLIYYKKLTKTGQKKLFGTLPFNWELYGFIESLSKKTKDRLDLDNIDVCDGRIVSNIGCHEEPGYGEEYSTWAELDVIFECEVCKQQYHPNLPRDEASLNEWLTKIIAELP